MHQQEVETTPETEATVPLLDKKQPKPIQRVWAVFKPPPCQYQTQKLLFQVHGLLVPS